MKKIKIIISVILITAICFSFCACRTRTSKEGENEAITNITQKTNQTDCKKQPDDSVLPEPAVNSSPVKNENSDSESEKQSTNSKKSGDNRTDDKTNNKKEDKNAVETKKETSESNDIINDTDEENNNTGSNGTKPDESSSGNINDDKDDQSDRNDLNEKDEQEEEIDVQTAIDNYKKLLSVNNANIYECQRMFAYCELQQDYCAANDKTLEHKLIIEAGGYNTGEHKNTIANDDWVIRKNPDVIIKYVDSSVLGKGIASTAAAQEIADSISTRNGWNEIPAVQSNSIIIISDSLLETQAGQLTIELCIAKTMYPALYSDVDISKVYKQTSGSDFDGIYLYY